MADVVLVLPEVSDDRVSNDLRELTETIVLNGHAPEYAGGILYGYGVSFENDVFMLHPYCWCDLPECPWCRSCECPDEAVQYLIGDREVDVDEFFDAGGYGREGNRSVDVPEHQCMNCRNPEGRAANFLHKPSGSAIRWYKYIGRGMEVDLRADWRTAYAECLASLAGAR